MLFAVALAMTVACNRGNTTSPSPVNLTATWINGQPRNVTGQTTVWTLVQTGTAVAGTSRRTADFVIGDSERSRVMCPARRSRFDGKHHRLWRHGHVPRGDDREHRHASPVDGTVMRGTISSVQQPPCGTRASIAEYSFRRQ